MRVAIIFHNPCLDGSAAAAAAVMWCRDLGHDFKLLPARYGNEPPDISGYGYVIVADFSYPRKTMEMLAEQAKGNIVVYDHHKTAEAELKGLPYAYFDMNRSGAGITWDELHGGNRPWWIHYAEDRDLWKWELPDSREINAYFQTQDGSPEFFLDLPPTQSVPDHVRNYGIGAQMFINAYVKAMNKDVKRLVKVEEFEGIPVLNVPYKETSSVVGEAAVGVLFAVGWHQAGTGKYAYSLRSNEHGSNFDVSEFAKRFGGGGHRNAAGFVADKQLW